MPRRLDGPSAKRLISGEQTPKTLVIANDIRPLAFGNSWTSVDEVPESVSAVDAPFVFEGNARSRKVIGEMMVISPLLNYFRGVASPSVTAEQNASTLSKLSMR